MCPLALIVVLCSPVFSRADEEGLEARIAPLAKAHKGTVAVAVKNLTTGEEYYLTSAEVMPTASLIKLPHGGGVLASRRRQVKA